MTTMFGRVRPVDLAAVACRSLWENRLRSFLTLLGLTIGVSSLILVMTIIQGANDFVADRIAGLGAHVFKATKLANIGDGFDAFIRSFRRKDITWDQYRQVVERVPSAVQTGAQAATTVESRHGGERIENTTLEGATEHMFEIGTRELADGRTFTETEARAGRRVCVIGHDLREHLFAGLDPLGRTLRLGGTPYQVVGVCTAKGSILGQSQDNFAIVPLPAFFHQFGRHRSLEIYFRAPGLETMEAVMDEARLALRTLRGRQWHQEDDFTLVTADTTLSLFHSITDNFFTVFLMLTAVAAIVGGIVIMNIMLVSVSQRVSEVGVRRAVGATQADVLRQFLLESVLLCLAGGILGVALGQGGAAFFASLADMPAGVRLWVAAFGVLLSAAIGLFFGIYPATRAARLDPVVALQTDR